MFNIKTNVNSQNQTIDETSFMSWFRSNFRALAAVLITEYQKFV